MQNQPVVKLKQAIKSATKVFVWVPFATMAPAGTTIGGYVEAYKTHVTNMLKEFQTSNSTYDTTLACAFRLDEKDNVLYVEGFHVL